MDNRQSPCSHFKALDFCLAAEVEIVEVKEESLIKSQAMGQKGLAPTRNQESIQQPDLLAGHTEGAQIFWRKTETMTHNPA